MLALSIDNLLFILLIAAAALFQLLSRAVSKANKNEPGETSTSPRPRTPPPIRRAPAESDADRIRKFLEALGQPASSSPPPPVVPRTDVPPRGLAPVRPPTAIPRAWGLPGEKRTKPDTTQREIRPPEQPTHVEFIRPAIPAPIAPTFEVHQGALAVELQQPAIVKTPIEASTAAARAIAKEADVKADIAVVLASKSGLRDAIILREIFGPPRGLQELEFVGS